MRLETNSKTMKRYKRKRETGLAYLIFGVAVLGGTFALVIFGRLEATWPSFAALVAGAALGIWLFRSGSRHGWVPLLCLLGALAVCVTLWMNVDVVGPAGIAWIGGFVAGTHFGVAWRLAAKNQQVTAAKAAWAVDGQGFSTVAEARKAAGAALHALDGGTRGRLSVDRGSARFEVAGGVALGLVCHRNADATNEGSWAVLVRSAGIADESVEIPMGDVKGFMPSRLVHDLDSVEAALADFCKNPGSSSFGPEWVTGSEAGATRLTTY
ncbi:hypothetical protein QFZ23_002545 [Arthrobacter globiformis]|uniref:hypothetical protein n=1 Tax=Arthrobacter globiformis TaxID=1665 RepID=UPI00277E49EA|nr:hypothetical protein [Arthrobacter globiformis]MDQ1058644.1 hypothetical protein [Arthrobacter globiformis]